LTYRGRLVVTALENGELSRLTVIGEQQLIAPTGGENQGGEEEPGTPG
jgi:hypothetical protein